MTAQRVVVRRLVPAVSAVLLASAMVGCSSDADPGPQASSDTSSLSVTTVAAPPDSEPTTPATTTSNGPPEGSDTTVYERGDIDEGLRPFCHCGHERDQLGSHGLLDGVTWATIEDPAIH